MLPVGIDTLILHSSRPQFIFDKGGLSSKLIQVESVDGDYLYRTYSHTEDGIEVSINGKGLRITFTFSEVFNTDDPLVLLDSTSLKLLENKLNELFNQLSIEPLTARDLSVVRIDITRDVITDYPFGAYRQILDALHFPRTSSALYPNYYRMFNGGLSVVFYGKSGEVLAKTHQRLPVNIMRGEVRLLKKATAQKHGIQTLGDILDDFSILSRIYGSIMGQIFSNNLYRSPAGSDWKLQLIASNWKSAQKMFLSSILVDVPDHVLVSSLQGQFSKNHADKIVKELSDIRKSGLPVDAELPSLYTELQSKFMSDDAPLLRWSP